MTHHEILLCMVSMVNLWQQCWFFNCTSMRYSTYTNEDTLIYCITLLRTCWQHTRKMINLTIFRGYYGKKKCIVVTIKKLVIYTFVKITNISVSLKINLFTVLTVIFFQGIRRVFLWVKNTSVLKLQYQEHR